MRKNVTISASPIVKNFKLLDLFNIVWLHNIELIKQLNESFFSITTFYKAVQHKYVSTKNKLQYIIRFKWIFKHVFTFCLFYSVFILRKINNSFHNMKWIHIATNICQFHSDKLATYSNNGRKWRKKCRL